MSANGNKEVSPFSATPEFIKAIYFDATETIRHYDGVRATFTEIFAAMIAVFMSGGAALFAHISLNWLLGGSLVLLALSTTSLIAILKINDLIALQRSRAAQAMQSYRELVKDFDLSAINSKARDSSRSMMISRVSLGSVWASMFAILTVTSGVITLFLAYRMATA